MASRKSINEGVSITAWYFSNRRKLATYPRRMEWAGRSYTFLDGLQMSINRQGSVTRIFDMTDGQQSYRLKCAGETNWTLVAITEHA